MTKQTFRVIVLDFALPEQRALSAPHPLAERTRLVRVFLFTICSEVEGEQRKIRSIRAEVETCSGKICRRFENTKGSWVHAMIFALLAGCFAVTLFFAFQAPFRLRVNEDLANPTTFRAEIAALPATLKSQTISRFPAHGSQQNAGYHKTENALDDSPRKRRVLRERQPQQRQSEVSIRPGQFSGHN